MGREKSKLMRMTVPSGKDELWPRRKNWCCWLTRGSMQDIRTDVHTAGWLRCSLWTKDAYALQHEGRMSKWILWIPSGRNSWNRLSLQMNFPERLRGYAVTKMIIPCVFPCLDMQPTKLSPGSGCIYMLMPVNANFLIWRLHLCIQYWYLLKL